MELPTTKKLDSELSKVTTCLEMIQEIIDSHTKRIELMMDNLKQNTEMHRQCLDTFKVMRDFMYELSKQGEDRSEQISHLANASQDTNAAMAILVKEVTGLVNRVHSLESPRINTELN